MSERAGVLFHEATTNQLMKNDARRVRTRVDEARRSPEDAGGRWPFELLQNATDAGPRAGEDQVSVSLGWSETDAGPVVWFEHDGQPFQLPDLAALLSGGSSKEYESDGTTGRFGTGFLVTHVLSPFVRVRGLLAVEDGVEEFLLELDRSGNEDAIVRSRQAAEPQIKQAVPVTDPAQHASARFEWPAEDPAAWRCGIDALAAALPYVFGTREGLGVVQVLEQDGVQERWAADKPTMREIGGIHYVFREIEVRRDDMPARALRVVRVAEGETSALMLLEQGQAGGWAMVLPPPSLARVFRRFPVRGTNRVPLVLILDGPFDVDQERRQVLLDEKGLQLIPAALRAGAAAVRLAIHEGWTGAHRLAMASEPPDVGSELDRVWWKSALSTFALELARLPVVSSIRGCWPAVSDGALERWADFPLPRLRSTDASDALSLERMWRLMAGTTVCAPPILELVADWAEIASGWAKLDVGVRRMCLADLAEDVAASGGRWDALEAVDRPSEWLVDFLDAVGLAWARRGGSDPSMLKGLLPDQTGALRDPSSLERDGGVPEELKEIAHELGIIVREKLLHLDIEAASRDTERWPSLGATLSTAVPRTRSKEQVIEECLRVLEIRVPIQKPLTVDDRKLASIGARLLRFLWLDKGVSSASQVGRIPLGLLSGQCDRATVARRMMLPVSCWRTSAQRYSDAWPPGRILDEAFAEPVLREALVALDLAFADIMVQTRAAELEKGRLAGMMFDDPSHTDTDGLAIKDESFPMIAMLHPEVLLLCQEGEVHARALLGVVVDCLGREEQGWKTPRQVVGVRRGEKVPVLLRDALWLGHLRSREWVPGKDDMGAPSKVRAQADSLGPLLDQAWLRDNSGGIELLTQCFGFDRLELELLSATPDRAARQAVRQQLAALIAATSGRPDLLRSVIAAAEEQRRQQHRIDVLRNYGLAVQEAVKAYLDARQLKVALVDRGYDYRVELGQQVDLDDVDLARFDVGPWFVEVKATTRDEVALTPLQARTAGLHGGRFVLCVVPFDQIPEVSPEGDDLLAAVEASARMVLDLGPDAASTTSLVASAAASEVSIRNDQQLRYAVPRRRWEAGITIEEWVDGLGRVGGWET